MIDDNYLQGYISALNNINSAINNLAENTTDYNRTVLDGYNDVQNYIKTVKNNYKQLVKELNETQSKKS